MTSTLPQYSSVLSNTSLIVSLTLTSHTSPWQFWCHPDILASSLGTFLLPTAVTRSPRVSATRQIERPRWPVAPNTFFVQQNALSFSSLPPLARRTSHTACFGGFKADGGSQEAGRYVRGWGV